MEKKKMVTIGYVLLLLLAAYSVQAQIANGIIKEIINGPDVDGDGEIDLVVETGQLIETSYVFKIEYANPGGPSVLIKDTVPAEWQAILEDDDSGSAAAIGANKKNNGKSATKISWIPIPDGGMIVVNATTRGPKKNDKFKPTSCGAIELNDGAAVFETDPITGEILNEETPLFESNNLCLVTVEDLNGDGVIIRNGSGDEDDDGLSDLYEACTIRTNPCLMDTDGDGIPDGSDPEPLVPNI